MNDSKITVNKNWQNIFTGSDRNLIICKSQGFPGGSDSKESACYVGDLSLIPGLGRFTGGGHGNLLNYACLENPIDRGAWWTTVHGVAKSWTQLSD